MNKICSVLVTFAAFFINSSIAKPQDIQLLDVEAGRSIYSAR